MPTFASHRPEIFRLSEEKDRVRLQKLQGDMNNYEVYDTLEEQLVELLITRTPSLKSNPSALATAVSKEIGEAGWEGYGVWVWYPWNRSLVRLLGEEEFIEVRTNRNKNKILPLEQQELRAKWVGIVGLSVGSSLAMNLAMERICGGLRLADFDVIELSNLNRIATSVAHLGLPKAIATARAIAEIDPYFEVEIELNGLTTDNIGPFFEGLDVVCDACDQVSAKANIRWHARQVGIPVIMETSDRGMIDIERYDGPNPRFLHGRIDEEMLREMRNATEWTPAFFNAFVDVESVSERGRASLGEMGNSLVGWPQLYTDVAAGGAHAAQLIRKILLGEPLPDARIYLEWDEQFVESIN